MFHYFGTATNQRGDALGGWQVEVVEVDTSTVVNIFSDENSTPITGNKAATDTQTGNFDFFVASGTYSLKFYNAAGEYQYTQRYMPMYGADNATAAADSAAEAAASAAAALASEGAANTSAIAAAASETAAAASADDAANSVGAVKQVVAVALQPDDGIVEGSWYAEFFRPTTTDFTLIRYWIYLGTGTLNLYVNVDGNNVLGPYAVTTTAQSGVIALTVDADSSIAIQIEDITGAPGGLSVQLEGLPA